MSKRKADARGSSSNAEHSAREDAALAELLALLDPAPFTPAACVSALRRANYDVSAAAELLLVGGAVSSSSSQTPTPTEPSNSPRKKRARQGGLKQWFTAPPKLAPDTKPAGTPPTPPPRSPSPPSSLVNREASAAGWAALLSRPPREKDKEKARTTPQRPTYLATPAAVAASGLPLALIQSPLSPSFAAQLFHEMMGESAKWGRNKMFIAGRECESNHQAASYARAGNEWGVDEGEVGYIYNGARYESMVSCEGDGS